MRNKTIWLLAGLFVTMTSLTGPIAHAFNPQPEPPGKIFKLNDGRQAIIINKRLYLLRLAPRGRYKSRNGSRFNVGTRGIIIQLRQGKLRPRSRLLPAATVTMTYTKRGPIHKVIIKRLGAVLSINPFRFIVR